MNNLAVAVRCQGKSDEAAQTLGRVNAILEQRREDDPILRGHAKRNLALSLLNSGDLEQACAANQEALADQRRSLGVRHPNTRMTMVECAELLDRLGRSGEAGSLRAELADTALAQPTAQPSFVR